MLGEQRFEIAVTGFSPRARCVDHLEKSCAAFAIRAQCDSTGFLRPREVTSLAAPERGDALRKYARGFLGTGAVGIRPPLLELQVEFGGVALGAGSADAAAILIEKGKWNGESRNERARSAHSLRTNHGAQLAKKHSLFTDGGCFGRESSLTRGLDFRPDVCRDNSRSDQWHAIDIHLNARGVSPGSNEGLEIRLGSGKLAFSHCELVQNVIALELGANQISFCRHAFSHPNAVVGHHRIEPLG